MENIWLDKLGGRNLGIAVLVVTVTALSPVQWLLTPRVDRGLILEPAQCTLAGSSNKSATLWKSNFFSSSN